MHRYLRQAIIWDDALHQLRNQISGQTTIFVHRDIPRSPEMIGKS
mgnify:CR=1 FL=1